MNIKKLHMTQKKKDRKLKVHKKIIVYDDFQDYLGYHKNPVCTFACYSRHADCV